MRRIVLTLTFLLFGISNVHAAFVSGSTGADGVFAPTANITVQLPDSGVFNYTTVNIPTGVTVTFTKNAANTPVYILATGDVVIAGTIKVDGGSTSSTTGTAPGICGPGGYNGGYGGASGVAGGKGIGPGGGAGGPSTQYYIGGGGGFGTAGGSYGANYGAGGPAYGNVSIVPLIGGSGGGGGAGSSSAAQYGGGGGGAILIASSTTITVTGSITATGGTGYNGGGGGSGGAIRLIANTISGTGTISARGGSGTATGGQGRVRLEASTNYFTLGTDPVYSYGQPGSPFVANTPVLRITSVAGASVPANPTGSYAQPDILLPNTTTNPVTVNLSASYIPVGTSVTVSVMPQYGSSSSVTTSLSGVLESSTASANVNLSTSYSNVIMAQSTFTLTASLYWDGEKIEKVRVAATMGKDSETVYITESGKEIKAELLAGLVR